MKILALQHAIDVRHRTLGVGMTYATPPSSGLDVFNISELDFEDLKKSELIAGKWFGRTLGLPKKYVEGIFELSNVNSEKIGKDLNNDEIKKNLSHN